LRALSNYKFGKKNIAGRNKLNQHKEQHCSFRGTKRAFASNKSCYIARNKITIQLGQKHEKESKKLIKKQKRMRTLKIEK
jgi:hypothetical protein